MKMIPRVRRWKYTAHYDPPRARTTSESYWIEAPTRQLALWAGREQAHGHWIIRPADVAKETVGLSRK